MADSHVHLAYASRAAEYTAILGTVDDMHELDRRSIGQWAEQISGPAIDSGCGPGHWTDFLHKRGVDVTGIDLVPEFIDSARIRFPDVPFRLSSLRALDAADGSLDGLLAWYSLIHLPPAEVPQVLSEFARALTPQGHLLVGFFPGESSEPFDHAVTRAYYWSVDQMSSVLQAAGFNVIDVETRLDPGSRAHAAIYATLA